MVCLNDQVLCKTDRPGRRGEEASTSKIRSIATR